MSWVRFVPGFSRHPKRLKSGPISSWLWVCSVDHCTEYVTDGFLDEAAVPSLCPTIVGAALKRAVDNLVAVGSWEKVEGGYIVHNYLEHNLSKAQVEADRAAARTRYTSWKSRHQRAPEDGAPNAVANAVAAPVSNAVTNAVANAGNNAEATFLPVSQSVSRTTKLRSNDGSRHQGAPERRGGPPRRADAKAAIAALAAQSGMTDEQMRAEMDAKLEAERADATKQKGQA
jgi:hypothetical protein